MKVQLHIEIEEQRISDLLCSALEGGVTYWADIKQDAGDIRGEQYWSDAPMAGGYFTVITLDGDDVNGEKSWRVDRQSCERGLRVMSEKYPQHFANFMAENDDAETGDVFIQCICFGELVFG